MERIKIKDLATEYGRDYTRGCGSYEVMSEEEDIVTAFINGAKHKEEIDKKIIIDELSVILGLYIADGYVRDKIIVDLLKKIEE